MIRAWMGAAMICVCLAPDRRRRTNSEPLIIEQKASSEAENPDPMGGGIEACPLGAPMAE
jgi:hypothetical protein